VSERVIGPFEGVDDLTRDPRREQLTRATKSYTARTVERRMRTVAMSADTYDLTNTGHGHERRYG